MWILARLLLTAVVLFVRLARRASTPEPTGSVDGAVYFVRRCKPKERITGFRLGVPLRGPWFRLSHEGSLDLFFKRMGIAREAETGDPEFDEMVYVAGDHPALHELLTQREPLRELIKRAFAFDFLRITSDGAALWLDKRAAREPAKGDLKLAVELGAAFRDLEHQRRGRQRDRFFWKALAVEAVVWSILAYAIGCAIELWFHQEDYHLHQGGVIGYGLVAALLVFVLLFGAIASLLRGSSRGHRILIEGALVLVLALPVTGIQLVSDLNRGLDRAEPIIVTRTVQRIERQEHRGKNGGRSYSYHLYLVPARPSGPVDVPVQIRISEERFGRAIQGGTVAVQVGRGFLGLPWYRGMTFSR